jgi:serine/threonine protein kinase
MFMEPMEADLHQIIRSGQLLSNSHVQYFMYQLFRGMKVRRASSPVYDLLAPRLSGPRPAVHPLGPVLHRDIKPGNVLVNADCEVRFECRLLIMTGRC